MRGMVRRIVIYCLLGFAAFAFLGGVQLIRPSDYIDTRWSEWGLLAVLAALFMYWLPQRPHTPDSGREAGG
jgi:hypothetical protein